MPTTAAFIDECRAAFGADEVNAQIKLGMQGAQTFYASENGHLVGTPSPDFDELRGITPDRMVIRPSSEADIFCLNNVRRSGASLRRQ